MVAYLGTAAEAERLLAPIPLPVHEGSVRLTEWAREAQPGPVPPA